VKQEGNVATVEEQAVRDQVEDQWSVTRAPRQVIDGAANESELERRLSAGKRHRAPVGRREQQVERGPERRPFHRSGLPRVLIAVGAREVAACRQEQDDLLDVSARAPSSHQQFGPTLTLTPRASARLEGRGTSVVLLTSAPIFWRAPSSSPSASVHPAGALGSSPKYAVAASMHSSKVPTVVWGFGLLALAVILFALTGLRAALALVVLRAFVVFLTPPVFFAFRASPRLAMLSSP
jgi:hypothetical protein